MNPHNNTPRFVTSFRVAGTKSFRLAAGKLFGEFGGNGQNLPKPLAYCLAARPGYSFINTDQTSAEALVVGYLAAPGNYRELFIHGVKPHSLLALHIFGRTKPHWFHGLTTPMETFLATTKPSELVKLPGWDVLAERIALSDVNEVDRPYMCGKRTAHARSYKMGARTFQEAMLKDTQGTMVLSYKQAQNFLATFDALFPEVINWQQEVTMEARAAKKLTNLFGFPRECHQIFTDGYERELISWMPQSTVGCITHEGVLRFRKMKNAEPKKYNQWHLVSNKHDAILLEVPDCDLPDAAHVCKQLMVVDLIGRAGVAFQMRADLQHGKKCVPAKKNNPNDIGLREYKPS